MLFHCQTPRRGLWTRLECTCVPALQMSSHATIICFTNVNIIQLHRPGCAGKNNGVRTGNGAAGEILLGTYQRGVKTFRRGTCECLNAAKSVVVFRAPSEKVTERTARSCLGPASTEGWANQPWPSITPSTLQPATWDCKSTAKRINECLCRHFNESGVRTRMWHFER